MQSLKDAAAVLGLLLLLVSVKVAPVEDLGGVIPSAEAASGEADAGPDRGADADALPVGGAVPAIQLEQAPAVETSESEMHQVRIESDTHRCESSIVHVQTLDLGGSGERIILRIDTSDGQAKAGRVEIAEPAGEAAALTACKIG